MNDHAHQLKLLTLNACSWMGTIAGMQLTKDLLQIACLVASLAVSGFTIWHIRRKDAALAKGASAKDGL